MTRAMPRFDLNQAVDRLQQDGPTVNVEGQEITRAPLFETAHSQAKLYRLRPGQHIPAHSHSFIDDIFFCVRGHGRIRTWDAGGAAHDHSIEAGTVFLVEPETPHEVSCQGEEFCFVLLQTPKERYDFMPHKPSTA